MVIVDSNDFIHDNNGSFVVDNVGRRSVDKTPNKPIRKATPDHPTTSDLDLLEEAIFNSEGYKVTYLSLRFEDSHIAEDMVAGRYSTLRFLWTAKRWRPSRNGTRLIVVSPLNKYIK